MEKNVSKIANIGIFLSFSGPLQALKLYKNIYLVEEVLSFDLVGNM